MKAVTTDKDANDEVQWFVMSAYKNERKAEERLSGKGGLEHFIPKRYVVRVYHGVKSKRLVPVIPNLIFVHASRSQITEFKKLHNFVRFVMWGKHTELDYLTVPDLQMDNFIRIASQHQDESTIFYKPEEIDIRQGTRVRIHGGQFDGVEGLFVKVKGKQNRRVVVMLEGVMAVATEVHPDLIEVLK
jgi:transcription antitermination factor NusG